ncbi:uncharacterized protein LOC113229310 [Hyposmocoma kahamanoa]|uniref:uncharacterized protein LOC113229310 n=1 Tax=Hyposmocoma kahamanoa TaxID=1477025 RepID=UPI000E6D6273|nr:uncharacterized protein LOC113229310 [Hyposmocoma kahamanoa]
MLKTFIYTDSDTDNTSSRENIKKAKKPSILKPYTTVPLRKKKCKLHSKKLELDDSDYKEYRCRSISDTSCSRKIRGILKKSPCYKSKNETDWGRTRERGPISFYSSDDEDDYAPEKKARCLVGQVPRPAGSKPGRGGGVALIIRKAVKEPARRTLRVKTSSVSMASKKNYRRKLSRKRSY